MIRKTMRLLAVALVAFAFSGLAEAAQATPPDQPKTQTRQTKKRTTQRAKHSVPVKMPGTRNGTERPREPLL